MVTVVTSGYFDPLHVGHLECIHLAKQLGDKLIVILNNDKQITNNEAKDIYKNYPVFPASCLTNNNIRYWKTPNNGMCEPAEFCGGLYEPTIHPVPKPSLPPKWDNGLRVNYYDSSKFCE